MPRTARVPSRTGIYHIMLRGINRQSIFEDDEDRKFFIAKLRDCKEKSGYKLYAFCLMPNHVHLLIKEENEPIAKIFKRIGTSYAHWYNQKYERVGHLFQDRFRSENVEDKAYFLTVLRYILQNPMKAGLEQTLGNYRWSSYAAYVQRIGSITDVDFAIEVAGSYQALMTYLNTQNQDEVMDVNEQKEKVYDDDTADYFKTTAKCESAEEFQQMGMDQQKDILRDLSAQGISYRQLSRLTGFSKSRIEKYVFRESEEIIYRHDDVD